MDQDATGPLTMESQDPFQTKSAKVGLRSAKARSCFALIASISGTWNKIWTRLFFSFLFLAVDGCVKDRVPKDCLASFCFPAKHERAFGERRPTLSESPTST